MHIPGEDENGFRAIAQRSMLADGVKDSGAVTMFPPLAETWLRQVQADSDWKTFRAQDFRRLQAGNSRIPARVAERASPQERLNFILILLAADDE